MPASTSRHYTLFLGAATYEGSITAPTCSGTVDDANIAVTWSGVVGTQDRYTVQVFSEAALENLVYYSGVVSSAVSAHTIPSGYLLNEETYYLLVTWVETDGLSGETAVCSFTTNYETAVDVTGLTVKSLGGCGSADIPCHMLHWTQVVPAGSETFVQYEILRREPAASALWTRIATIPDVSTVSYTDYAVRSRALYQYGVIYEATEAGEALHSHLQTSANTGYVDFDYAWIHEVANPSNAAIFDQFEAQIQLIQDIVPIQHWGLARPVVHVGEGLYHEVTLPGLMRSNRELSRWNMLRTMQARQRDADAVYCVRLGQSQELWFASIIDLSRQVTQGQYTPNIRIVETDYDEAV